MQFAVLHLHIAASGVIGFFPSGKILTVEEAQPAVIWLGWGGEFGQLIGVINPQAQLVVFLGGLGAALGLEIGAADQ